MGQILNSTARPRSLRWAGAAAVGVMLLGGVLWLALRPGAAPAAAAPAVGFRIAASAIGNPEKISKELQTAGPLGYAIHLGVFQRELARDGFRFDGVVGFQRTAAALLGMMSGQAELASTGDSPAVLSRARGEQQRALYVTPPSDTQSGFWVVGRKGGPATLDALGGKRVGLLFGSTFDYAFQTAAQGLNLKDVAYTQLPSSAALPALQNDQLDAYVTSAAVAKLWVDRYGLTLVGKLGDVPATGRTVSVISARADFLAANPRFAAAFWRGLKAGIDAIRKDPEAYYRWSADSTGYPLDVVRATSSIDFEDRPISDAGAEALKKLLAFRVEHQVAQAAFSVDDWVVRQ
ncbi:transporter substrate-binding domain-containing protein [Pseudoduganella sp. FT26W]|uniref:Transporter substrate-binding domain-containing protein n=1 Tax=Duganella aquatilis TaxID=2666082 RepID=A0A844DGM5_9BURK|nr:transporter substrate-binding domain-containing protein [Duganella aquatilis]MRW87469.1 transporter substrate-binding domain-containing protein [Duganella aquatilis]